MSKKKLKVILCGYQWSGCKALKKINARKDISDIFVYTHKSEYYYSDLAEYCNDLAIKFTYKKISLNNLPFKPDIICSVSYSFIIPNNVLKLVDNRAFNIHPSLLPSYKGCSSVTWALVNGEKKYGFSYHLISKKIDSGKIIYQKALDLEKFDLQYTAYYRVMFESLKPFNKIFNSIVKRKFNIISSKTKASYYKRGAPFNGIIDEKWSVDFIKKFIKSMIFPPKKNAIFKRSEVNNFASYLKLKNERKN